MVLKTVRGQRAPWPSPSLTKAILSVNQPVPQHQPQVLSSCSATHRHEPMSFTVPSQMQKHFVDRVLNGCIMAVVQSAVGSILVLD